MNINILSKIITADMQQAQTTLHQDGNILEIICFHDKNMKFKCAFVKKMPDFEEKRIIVCLFRSLIDAGSI